MAETTSSSPITLAELERIKAALMLTDDDLAALRRARGILEPRVDELLDVWYGFVGSHDFLLHYFAGPDGPDGDYLAAVRRRFGQWVLDLTSAEYDHEWLAYQEEIGRRHYLDKGATDGVAGTPPLVSYRYMIPLAYPIYATVRPFLEQGEGDAGEVERMHQAWLKAVLLSVTLWSRPYLRVGAF
jgi:hypothetical protein